MFATAFAIAAALTAFGTLLVRRYAVTRALLDVPNHRSSHSTPTPRGGGLAIAVVLLVGLTLAGILQLTPLTLVIAIVGGGAMVAIIGWIDDHGGVRASYRALVHLAAAVWGVAWLGGLASIQIGTLDVNLGIGGAVLAVLSVVCFVNFYNFMDGIDGIAGGNGVVVSLVGAAMLAHSDPALALVAVLVAGCSAGFLLWNWPPAKIFLGDTGSGLLGFVFAMLAIASERRGSAPLLLWFVLLSVFLVDATLTLARRVLGGERWYDAHRSHAYQRLVQSGRSHLAVTSGVLVLNAFLGAAVLFANHHPRGQPAIASLAIAVVVACYVLVERISPMTTTRTREKRAAN